MYSFKQIGNKRTDYDIYEKIYSGNNTRVGCRYTDLNLTKVSANESDFFCKFGYS